ncbi:sensor histidine kinase [Sphingobacterium bambusae]|uniref:histidine kinase n=1 Tax=Sphingobacterium bambusae TaxID=662858 RepID=A0ABW6BRF0_9SPHI|nr:HAMP domain-containing sensor histidine kinase [Sphingobacterium bambusae]WPL48185.1 HAMP domain-containing sensor histidine kinase [Sphingobacterium bambusae]
MSRSQGWWAPMARLWQRIESVGVTPEMSYLQNRRLKMVNLIAVSAFVGSLCYGVGNILGGQHPILSIVDIFYALGTLFVFKLHREYLYAEAKVYLLIISSLFLITINFLSYNIAEYYLLCVLIVSILVFHRIWVQAVICGSLVIAILVPKFFADDLPYSFAVGEDRLLVNVPIAILFIFILVRHFKSIQQSYQEEIEKQQIHLEELNRDKEQLFAIVAHDIRSPLVATSQILQMLCQEETDELLKKRAIQQINAQLQAMTENVDNLLHWSSQNLKGLVSRPLHFPVEQLLSQVLQGMKTQTSEKNVTFETHNPQALAMFADLEQIRIILRNILNNAIKFSYENGLIEITVEQSDAQVQISVKDSGVGMSSKKVKELFSHPQHPSYGTSGERGTGLGLVLVNNLVQINQGTIKVLSRENVGTTVQLLFPLGKIAEARQTVANAMS